METVTGEGIPSQPSPETSSAAVLTFSPAWTRLAGKESEVAGKRVRAPGATQVCTALCSRGLHPLTCDLSVERKSWHPTKGGHNGDAGLCCRAASPGNDPKVHILILADIHLALCQPWFPLYGPWWNWFQWGSPVLCGMPALPFHTHTTERREESRNHTPELQSAFWKRTHLGLIYHVRLRSANTDQCNKLS